jgi:predicted transcriptional regulator
MKLDRKGVDMIITKQQVLEIVEDLPEEVDVDEVIYRLYLRQKLEVAERDIREGRIVPHEEVVKETSKWFKK